MVSAASNSLATKKQKSTQNRFILPQKKKREKKMIEITNEIHFAHSANDM